MFSRESVVQMGSFFLLPPQVVNGKTRCPVLTCEASFDDQEELLTHLQVGKHGQPCPRCNRLFGLVERLEIHVKGLCSAPSEKPFTCPMCERPHKDANELSLHMQMHGEDRWVHYILQTNTLQVHQLEKYFYILSDHSTETFVFFYFQATFVFGLWDRFCQGGAFEASHQRLPHEDQECQVQLLRKVFLRQVQSQGRRSKQLPFK